MLGRRYAVDELCSEYGIRYLRTPDVNGSDVINELHAAGLDFISVYWFGGSSALSGR